jgi:hypothetical protein
MKKFLIADLMKAIGEVDFIGVWRSKGYPEDFNFQIRPSKSKWGKNMHDDPAEVDAYPIYESIGSNGEDTPMYYVDVNWPSGSTEAPDIKTYEMDLDTLESWSNNTSGTYFNENIRGKF